MRFTKMMCLMILCVFLAGCQGGETEPAPGGYENYYSLNEDYSLVLEDPNGGVSQDRKVTVSLIQTDGPTSLDVKVSWKESVAPDWADSETRSVSLAGAGCSFSIPANYTFQVEAKATEGKNGYATLRIDLS